LIARFGEETAHAHGEPNRAAIDRIAQFVAEDGIDCDFERKPNYIYSESSDDLKAIENEVAAAQKHGFPMQFAFQSSLPFPRAGAFRLDN
jgi:hypothetical protein